MTSAKASAVKKDGHKLEDVFAGLVGGVTIPGTGKADVRRGDQSWSLKSGTWAQIFLYRGARAAELGPEFKGCIDIFPENRTEYLENKVALKTELQKPMRVLAGHLSQDAHLETFLWRAMFASSVDFLVIQKGQKFLEFKADDVVQTLKRGISVQNSKARNSTQLDDQKVVLYLDGVKAALGEIEVRNDSDQHYREIKCRFNVPRLCSWLETRCAVNEYLM